MSSDPGSYGQGFGVVRHRGRILEKGNLIYVILDILRDRPSHGYEIIRRLAEASRGSYAPAPGMVYPALQMLEEMACVTTAAQGSSKVYSITEQGRKLLADKGAIVEDIKSRMQVGTVGVYTGGGKGKTSAALGDVLRALGYGLKVYIVFFMKGDYPYGEQAILSKLPNVSFSRFGSEFCDPNHVREEEKERAQQALRAARQAVLSGDYEMVVLDEVNVATAWKLLPVEDVVALVKDKPARVELVLTGRGADQRIIELADLVTDMVRVKHLFGAGTGQEDG